MVTQRRFAVIAVCLVLIFGACGMNGPSTYRLATTAASPGDGYLGGLQGVLGGQVNGDGSACLWVQAAAPDKTDLIWPAGYTASDKPLRVVDASGKTLAAVGQTVALQGGRSVGQSAEGCHDASQTWVVAKVMSAK